MDDFLISLLTLLVIIALPLGLIALVTIRRPRRKKAPKLEIVQQSYQDETYEQQLVDTTIKDVIKEARKKNKNRKRNKKRNKRRKQNDRQN